MTEVVRSEDGETPADERGLGLGSHTADARPSPVMTVAFIRNARHPYDDIEVTVGDRFRAEAGSYYFALDDGVSPGIETRAKIAEVIRLLLEQWFVLVSDLEPGGTAYLPFDFSDQCTCWLQVDRVDAERVRLRVGWSGTEGWSFNPSDIISQSREIASLDVLANGPDLMCTRTELLAAITDSRLGIAE